MKHSIKTILPIIAMGSLLLSGNALAQTTQDPVAVRSQDRLQDGSRSSQFGVPIRLREDQTIQECVADYRNARDTFRLEIQQLRERMGNASSADQAAIRAQIRDHLLISLGEEREFRRSIRKSVRELRQQSAASIKRNGG